MEHIYINYTTYGYYEPSCDIEFSETEILKDVCDYNYCYLHYLRIDTKEELIKALEYLIEETTIYEREEVQVQDFIKLLKDSNFGDIFFERFVYNLRWYFKEHIDLYYALMDHESFLFLTKDGEDKLVLIPFYKEHKDFQKYLLQYCIDKDIKFKEEWFDISEEDIQSWRYEHNVNKLKEILHAKKLDLERIKRRTIKLDKEIEDLKKKIKDLTKEGKSE